MYHARVSCANVSNNLAMIDPSSCVLKYKLREMPRPFVVFCVALVVSVALGVALATTMYLAVARIAVASFPTRRSPASSPLMPLLHTPLYVKAERKGGSALADAAVSAYGSFGRRLNMIGSFDGSFASLLDCPVPPSPPGTPPSEEEGEEDERDIDVENMRQMERLAILQTELY